MALRTQILSLEDVMLIISNLEPKKSSLIYFVYSHRQSEVKSEIGTAHVQYRSQLLQHG